jgi:hypothetical protein
MLLAIQDRLAIENRQKLAIPMPAYHLFARLPKLQPLVVVFIAAAAAAAAAAAHKRDVVTEFESFNEAHPFQAVNSKRTACTPTYEEFTSRIEAQLHNKLLCVGPDVVAAAAAT